MFSQFIAISNKYFLNSLSCCSFLRTNTFKHSLGRCVKSCEFIFILTRACAMMSINTLLLHKFFCYLFISYILVLIFLFFIFFLLFRDDMKNKFIIIEPYVRPVMNYNSRTNSLPTYKMNTRNWVVIMMFMREKKRWKVNIKKTLRNHARFSFSSLKKIRSLFYNNL